MVPRQRRSISLCAVTCPTSFFHIRQWLPLQHHPACRPRITRTSRSLAKSKVRRVVACPSSSLPHLAALDLTHPCLPLAHRCASQCRHGIVADLTSQSPSKSSLPTSSVSTPSSARECRRLPSATRTMLTPPSRDDPRVNRFRRKAHHVQCSLGTSTETIYHHHWRYSRLLQHVREPIPTPTSQAVCPGFESPSRRSLALYGVFAPRCCGPPMGVARRSIQSP